MDKESSSVTMLQFVRDRMSYTAGTACLYGLQGCSSWRLSRKLNIWINLLRTRYERFLKEHEWNNFKFKYSQQTLSSVEIRAGCALPRHRTLASVQLAWVTRRVPKLRVIAAPDSVARRNCYICLSFLIFQMLEFWSPFFTYPFLRPYLWIFLLIYSNFTIKNEQELCEVFTVFAINSHWEQWA